jgi:hypothetical protein
MSLPWTSVFPVAAARHFLIFDIRDGAVVVDVPSPKDNNDVFALIFFPARRFCRSQRMSLREALLQQHIPTN